MAFITSMLMNVQAFCSDNQPMTDPAWIAKESQRIHEQYKNDPNRLSIELDAFNKRVSKALGTDKILERRNHLYRKYSPVSHATETLPAHDESAVIIDHDAWLFSLEQINYRLQVTFFLDRSRYHDTKPSNLRLQLRRRADEGETLISRWQESGDSFVIGLPYRAMTTGQFQTSIVIPERERAQYVIQIYADIEPGWATESVFGLK